MIVFPNTFYLSHFNTSNQIKNGDIKHIFKTYLVRSFELATVNSVRTNLQKIIIFGPTKFQIFSCFSSQLVEQPNINSNTISINLPCINFEKI